MDNLLDRLRAVRHHQSSDFDSGPRKKWTTPKNPDGEEAALRIEAAEAALENLRAIASGIPQFRRAEAAEADLTDIAQKATRAITELESRVKELEDALRPFSAAVFNDNGDVTISTGHIKRRDWMRLSALATGDNK